MINTLPRDWDLKRIIDGLTASVAELYRRLLTYQPLLTDTGWVTVPAAAGFTSSLQVRRIGHTITYRGTLIPTVDWGTANSLQMPVAAGAIPAQFRYPISLITPGSSGAGSAANTFRVAIQSNGGIQVRCNTASHTNSCSVNFTNLDN